MKRNLLAIAAMIGAITFGGNAQALMVAGWDFSQYLGDGILSIDGVEFTDTLDANYSHLVPAAATNSGIAGVGPQAAAFGTMYLNGQFGSTNVQAGSGAETFLPTAAVGGSLASNLTAPVNVADGLPLEFDVFTTLVFEGQTFANSQAMIAPGAGSVVFGIDLTSTLPGTDWSVSFGARTFAGTESIGIEFSTNGVDFDFVGSVDLTTIDTPFALGLGSEVANQAFVKFVFDAPEGPNQAIIDNVAVSATLIPEPGTALLLLTGLAGIAAHGRRRA